MKEDIICELIKKYPNLFPKDENGEPSEPVCSSFVPSGWEDLVDNLCGCINEYVSNSYKLEKKKDLYSRFLFFKRKLWTKFSRRVDKILDPYDPFRLKNTKSWIITPEIKEKVQQTKRYKIQQKLIKFGRKYFEHPDAYNKIYPPTVRIEQIKEKFGELRFYYCGGDDVVAGIVRAAEFNSIKICQETGNKGTLCKRGWWYATLSLDKAKEHGYTPVNE